MRMRRVGLAVALLCSLLGIACAGPPELSATGIPASADPDARIDQLALDLSAARSREIDRLSPARFRRAAEALERARALRAESAARAPVLTAVAEGAAALDAAETSAGAARVALAPAWEARSRALASGAARLGEPFEALERELRELARQIEEGDLTPARRAREELAERYLALELRAVEERILGDARDVLERARAEGARERVPEVFATAEQQLAGVEAFIATRPGDESELRERAEVARFFARRAAVLNRAARDLRAAAGEAVVLEQERRLRRLGEALGLPDRRDESLVDRWAALEATAEALRGDRDHLLAESERLRERLARARSEIDQLTGRNRALERQREFDERFARVRAEFAPGEAEVYRQGGQLIIRLRGLDFGVGEASIPPADYPLLAKVRKAIRTFGHPSVTIEGHTDSTGGRAANQRLSLERANAVRDHLVASHALPAHRILTVGRASQEPLASNETAEGRALNRRIDVILETRRFLTIAGVAPAARR